MPDISKNLEASFLRAVALAKEHGHLSVGTEHLLLSLMEDPDVRVVLQAFRIDRYTLERRLLTEIDRYPLHFQEGEEDPVTTPLSIEVNRVIGVALKNADVRGQQQADGVNALFGILEGNTSASAILEVNGITISDLSYWMQFGISEGDLQKPAQEKNTLVKSIFSIDEINQSVIPHQTTAPIRVSDRNGRIIRISDYEFAADVDELDFDRWRAPVADSLAELLDTDLGPGTNHERLRRRLLALAAALAGTIDDVKANQFRLGYGIESLGDLVGVYRTAADDMPTLNAAVFADVNRLHIQLMLGLSKLVAWSRFQRDADADELHEGTADPAAVAAALAETEAVLAGDAAAPIVDPELPRSFRWIREAIADPKETTKRMVYGAVKSLENVGVFLGQLSLRTAKEAIETTAQQIGKRTSAALLLALSGALLHLSGALPVAWPWLKPLLEAAAKVVGG